MSKGGRRGQGQDPLLLRRLLRARDRMDAASHEAWPVARLARVSGVSEAHFARAFKQSQGTTPHEYLVDRRVAHACALLRETDTPLSEIALASGFADQSHFARQFKKRVGISPSEVAPVVRTDFPLR